jgi:hypothetical protein
VNGDNAVSPRDVLALINYINLETVTAEREEATDYVATLAPENPNGYFETQQLRLKDLNARLFRRVFRNSEHGLKRAVSELYDQETQKHYLTTDRRYQNGKEHTRIVTRRNRLSGETRYKATFRYHADGNTLLQTQVAYFTGGVRTRGVITDVDASKQPKQRFTIHFDPTGQRIRYLIHDLFRNGQEHSRQVYSYREYAELIDALLQ